MEPVSRKFIPEKLLFDTRLIDRNLRDGIITRDEYEAHMKGLESNEERIAKMDTQFSSLMPGTSYADAQDEE